MKEKITFSTHAEYENWLIENKDKIKECIYLNFLDIPFESHQISARAYNVLRMNKHHYISDIIFYSVDDLLQLNMINKAALDEIMMIKREYLKEHKETFINYINKSKFIFEPEPQNFSDDFTIDVDSSNESTKILSFEEQVLQDDFVSKTIVQSDPEEKSLVKEHTVVEDNMAKRIVITGNVLLDVKNLLISDSVKEKIIVFFEQKKISISDIDLSNRSYNALRRFGIEFLHQMIPYYPEGFNSIQNMGANSVKETCVKLEDYLTNCLNELLAYIYDSEIHIEQSKKSTSEEETDPYKLSVLELLNHPIFKDIAIKYLQRNDVSIDLMGFNTRGYNALKRSGIHSLYEIFSIYPDKLFTLKSAGPLAIGNIIERMEYHISKMYDSIAAYCNGDSKALYSDDLVTDKIMSCFDGVGFKGISFKEIREELPEEIDDSRIKKCIGKLLADNRFEYVDYRLYRVYPSVFSFIKESSLSDIDKDIIHKKFVGITLETIAQDYGLTRERVRQKLNKNLRKLRIELQEKQEFDMFDEDYYEYLFTNYEVFKEMWLDYLCVSKETFGYLVNAYSKGSKSISDALSDSKIDLGLKFKIQDYLNRNKILLDGVLVERKRADIEKFALHKFCQDELTYDEFAEKYNNLLKDNEIDFDEKIYYTDDIRRTRSNHLSASMLCLWKHGERLRYYDIAGQDYTELLETLNLDKFRNIEISTLKFIEDYPDVMEKYDIRDQYELHNLLKKIVDVDDYHDIDFNRQPMIRFGEFDREAAIYSVLEAVAPVTIEELAEYVHMEFGYDKMTATMSYFKHLTPFYHQGVYSINFKRIPEERVSLFKEKLTEDFYYISEIKDLYKENFDDVDLEEINPLSLKALGFKVNTTYAIQNFPSAEAYFSHILTSQDVYDISEMNSKYANNKTYYVIYNGMRKSYDILFFERNQVITINRLNKLGIGKEDIQLFCDKVADFIDNRSYFTVHSLKKSGFEAKLFDLGFDDYFYASTLAMDSRFVWQHVCGIIVLTKKSESTANMISKKDFFLHALSHYDSIEIDDFISDCYESYGIVIDSRDGRYDITSAIEGSDFYYDSIMGKFYRNKDYYYSEFDD